MVIYLVLVAVALFQYKKYWQKEQQLGSLSIGIISLALVGWSSFKVILKHNVILWSVLLAIAVFSLMYFGYAFVKLAKNEERECDKDLLEQDDFYEELEQYEFGHHARDDAKKSVAIKDFEIIDDCIIEN